MELIKEINDNIWLFIEAAEDILNGLDKQLHEDIEWEPQPEWQGKKGETGETGAGMQRRRQQEMLAKVEKIKKAYANAVKQLETAPPARKAAIQDVIAKLEAIAQKHNIKLPSAGDTGTLGLPPA